MNRKGKKVNGQQNGVIKIAKGELMASNGLVNGATVAIDMNSNTCLDLQGE